MIKYHGGTVHVDSRPGDGSQFTIGNIVRILEESTAITGCAEPSQKTCGVCNKAGDCLSRWVWVEASRAMFERLSPLKVL